jgi:glycosyltransferase involved in cell wall biosynthesis
VDHQIFLSQRFGGISNYHSIIHQTINDGQAADRSTILALGSNNEYLEGKMAFLKPLNVRGKKVLRAINERTVSRMMPSFDVFHPSYYDNYFLTVASKPPFVLTVHDMIPEKNFYHDDIGRTLISNKKNLIYKAARIIAISEATKKDLLSFYDIDPDRIDVIHHGYPVSFDKLRNPMISATINMPAPLKPYFLFVGTR